MYANKFVKWKSWLSLKYKIALSLIICTHFKQCDKTRRIGFEDVKIYQIKSVNKFDMLKQ